MGSRSFDSATVAYDASNGETLWVQRYDGPQGLEDGTGSLAVSPDGTKIFVTGISQGREICGPPHEQFPCSEFITIAYDASTGAQLWVMRYTNTASGNEAEPSLSVSPDGTRVFITGSSEGPGTCSFPPMRSGLGSSHRPSEGDNYPCPDYVTIAYDAFSGAQLWVARYDGPGHNTDAPRSMTVSPDGTRVFVTGYSVGAVLGPDYATVAYDSITGTQLWVSRYDGPGRGEDVAASIGVTPDGSDVLVTGSSRGLHDYDIATISYDSSTGAERWVKRYTGAAIGALGTVALAVSPKGDRVIVFGPATPYQGGFLTIAYSTSDGELLWHSYFTSAVETGATYPADLAVSVDGTQAFVTGSFPLGGSIYATTVAYDAFTGAQLWVARYGPGGSSSVVASPDGTRVFVTGGGFSPESRSDYTTVAYSTR